MEDESGDATDRFESEISSAGFETVRAHSAGEARDILKARCDSKDVVDLVVLDRKLPAQPGGLALESVGDALFRDVVSAFADAAIVVLTGFSDEDFTQMVLQRTNSLDVGPCEPVPQVMRFRKGDALEFRRVLRVLGSALQRTEDIAIEGSVASLSTRRVLKRVGQLFHGAVVHARSAVGGLSSSSVWICDITATDGRLLTSVVVKVGAHGDQLPSGGFMASVPAANAARPSHMVRGVCGRASGHVAPLAGHGCRSLSDLLSESEPKALEAVIQVVAVLDKIPSSVVTIPLDAFIAPLIDWSRAETIAADFGVELPRRTWQIQSHRGCLHGDLHPGNVLLDEDRPVFIDFDRQRDGSPLIDSLSLALGAVFNRGGALRAGPPALEDVVASLESRPGGSPWLNACTSSWGVRGFGMRERWAAALAYSLRQLKYDDVVEDSRCRSLAVGLARHAAEALRQS